MQANLSLILNVILLIGVVIAIGRLMLSKRQKYRLATYQPPLSKVEHKSFDDIIAVRKISQPFMYEDKDLSDIKISASEKTNVESSLDQNEVAPFSSDAGLPIMMFLLAKENRKLAGYELLQTMLAAGLRFGEGHLFHRHQYTNGKGPILCSLAAATPTGVFDLQNIGAFSVRGLCIFMQSSGNSAIDEERFNIMLDTAKQLSDELDTLLLDDEKRPLTNESLSRYYRMLNIAFHSPSKLSREREEAGCS